MTTVINTPPNNESTGGGFVLGALFVAIVLVGLYFVYGLPALKKAGTPETIDVNIQLPAKTP